MCNQDKIVAGGGVTSIIEDFGPERGGEYQPHEIGFGLQLGSSGSLLEGSSSPSLIGGNIWRWARTSQDSANTIGQASDESHTLVTNKQTLVTS